MQHPALRRRDIDRRKSARGIGRQRGGKRRIGAEQPLGDVVVNRLPGLGHRMSPPMRILDEWCRRPARSETVKGGPASLRAMKTAAILLAPLALSAAATNAAPPPRTVTARIGETVHVHGIRLRPLEVLEDSRCPQNARCVSAGRVRLSVRMGGVTRELTLGRPVPMVGGTLQLAAVLPPRMIAGRPIPPGAYRFGFLFQSDGRIELIGG